VPTERDLAACHNANPAQRGAILGTFDPKEAI
jgi:hypothetical protein